MKRGLKKRNPVLRALWVVFGAAVCFVAASGLAESRPRFMTGADVSSLPHLEKQGIKYFDNGRETDFIEIARRNKWNILRVRLWVDPADKPESQVSSLSEVTKLGQRIKAARFQFLLDIHYSDSWADPSQQKKPTAWANLPFEQLEQRVHDYTRDVIVHLRAHDAAPDMVQIGNETKSGFLYGSGLNGADAEPGGGFNEPDKGGRVRFLRLFAAGTRGVRDGAGRRAPLTKQHKPDRQNPAIVRW
jgi:arabinogalactan endo-1,4-beta-galactosidase